MDEVLERDSALAQARVVEEEALGVGVLESQAPGLSLGDEVESQLRGASASKLALGTAPARRSGGLQAVEGATRRLRLAVVVVGAGVAEAHDARVQAGLKAMLGVEHKAARVHLQVVHGRVM